MTATYSNDALPFVLTVDDDPEIGLVLPALLRQAGFQAEHASSGHEALNVIESKPFDLVITDIRMPGMDGLQLLRHLTARVPGLPIVCLTAFGTIPVAVEAMKAGAVDFLVKPFDRDELVFILRKVLAVSEKRSPHDLQRPGVGPIVGEAPIMQQVFSLLQRAAGSDATVLIRGESGTGKSTIARAIHEHSARSKGPFVHLCCADIPDNLLESELFGYEKGAFCGAASSRPGRIELAERGTLFLDEIGDLSLAMQARLLRILQEWQLTRMGGYQTQRVDVRFVASTNRNLESLIAAGRFRSDLYYRLNVVPIWVPPLRERPGDAVRLARHFVQMYGQEHARPTATFTEEALALIGQQSWPGNVGELEAFVERLVVLSDASEIGRLHVEQDFGRTGACQVRSAEVGDANASPHGAARSDRGTPLGLDQSRRTTEREAVLNALNRAGNNRTLAARLLGVSRRTLYNKLQEHGIA